MGMAESCGDMGGEVGGDIGWEDPVLSAIAEACGEAGLGPWARLVLE